MDAESVLSLPEHELVAKLYEDLHLFQHVAIPPQTPWPSQVFLRVAPRAIGLERTAFGDVDALLVPNEAPHLARAVEFKRVLMSGDTFSTIRPNKLHELAKGVVQANRLASTGFAFVWLSVLVLVDSRVLTEHTGGYLGASREMMDAVYRALPLGELNSAVGVTMSELTQCFDRPIGTSGMMGGHVVRMATPLPQPTPLTAGIAALAGARPPRASAER